MIMLVSILQIADHHSLHIICRVSRGLALSFALALLSIWYCTFIYIHLYDNPSVIGLGILLLDICN